jgi:hypothetical protein
MNDRGDAASVLGSCTCQICREECQQVDAGPLQHVVSCAHADLDLAA